MRRLFVPSLVLVFLLSVGAFARFHAGTAALAPGRVDETAGGAPRLPASALPVLPEELAFPDAPSTSSGSEGANVAVVLPARRAAVRAAAAGTLRELLARAGDAVDPAEVVARIRDDEVISRRERSTAQTAAAKSRVREAEAGLELARYEQELREKLSESVSEAEMVAGRRRIESAEARLDALRAELAAARHETDGIARSLRRYEIRAPFAGRVTEVLACAHQYVDEGDIVLWIESHEKELKLHVDPEEVAGRDRIAVSVRVRDEWRELRGGVVRPAYNPDGTVTVVFELGRPEDLVAGQVLRAKVIARGGLR